MIRCALVLLPAIVSVILSCKKENQHKENVKRYIETRQYASSSPSSDTYEVTYDNNNRITLLQGNTKRVNYSYSLPASYKIDVYQGSVGNYVKFFYLNQDLLLDSTLNWSSMAGNSTTEKYVYNTAKQLVELTTYYIFNFGPPLVASRKSYLYDSNGNETQEIKRDSLGIVRSVTTFRYGSRKAYVPFGTSYMAPLYQQVLEAIIETYPTGAADTTTCKYTYDSNDRITSQMAVTSYGLTVKTQYFY